MIRLPKSWEMEYPGFYGNFNGREADVLPNHKFQPEGMLLVKVKGWDDSMYVKRDFCAKEKI